MSQAIAFPIAPRSWYVHFTVLATFPVTAEPDFAELYTDQRYGCTGSGAILVVSDRTIWSTSSLSSSSFMTHAAFNHSFIMSQVVA